MSRRAGVPVCVEDSVRTRVLTALPDDADGVILTSPGAVSWYLGGARTTVPLGGASVAAVLITRDGEQVRCHVMEAERLRTEDGIEGVVEVDWTLPLVPAEWRDDPRIRSEDELDLPLRAARASLTDVEIARYRALGADVAQLVTAVSAGLRPDDRERSVAGELAARIYSAGAEPVVLLVAGADRKALRHPVPTGAMLGDSAMLVVGARRHGLIVNLTRSVRFSGSAPAGERRLLDVEADIFSATTPGMPLADVFAILQRSYRARGFNADEWRNHHQGGPTGYFGRDPKVAAGTLGRVAERQAFAWNPSAPGIKVEDTVLATADGIELFTHDSAWPTVEVAGRNRPVPLQL